MGKVAKNLFLDMPFILEGHTNAYFERLTSLLLQIAFKIQLKH